MLSCTIENAMPLFWLTKCFFSLGSCKVCKLHAHAAMAIVPSHGSRIRHACCGQNEFNHTASGHTHNLSFDTLPSIARLLIAFIVNRVPKAPLFWNYRAFCLCSNAPKAFELKLRALPYSMPENSACIKKICVCWLPFILSVEGHERGLSLFLSSFENSPLQMLKERLLRMHQKISHCQPNKLFTGGFLYLKIQIHLIL
jgi:hypothetical protein